MSDDALSIGAAAQESGAAPAIVLDGASLSFADLGRASRCAPRTRCIVGSTGVETIAAIYRALEELTPLAILHPKLSPDEHHRQRTVLGEARLPDDTAFVLFTSGSTGTPRGVVLSRTAILANAVASAAHLGWRDDDAWLLALPLAHAGGLSVVVRCLVARKPIVTDARLAEGLARSTLASLVPTQLAQLLDAGWTPPASLRAILLGGAAAPASLLERAAAAGVPVLRTYGLTESFGQLATTPVDRAGEPEAPLVPLPGVQLYGGTREMPARIRVRAPMLATSYLDGTPIAPELETADLGWLDDDGLHVVGRVDDVIVSGGENVHPLEVEAALLATPGVRAACAFGVADVRWGQVVGAAIVVDAGFDLDVAVARWAALPPHVRPRELALVDALPMLANGKIDRRAAARLARTPIHYA